MTASESQTEVDPKPQGLHEDWLLVAVGIATLVIATLLVQVQVDPDVPAAKPTVVNYASNWFAKLSNWDAQPIDAFFSDPEKGDRTFLGVKLFTTWLVIGCVLLPIALFRRVSWLQFLLGYTGMFALGTLAFLMAAQETVKYLNFEYVLWALLLGMLINNTIGIPKWLQSMVIGESMIKLGLVLFGAEILFGKLVALGPPGIFTSWLVTPVVLITTFWFGQRVLKISSPSLNMVISADMSVCGVSAAIATGAACRAKREEISYAIGVSLFFTAIMMVVQPQFVLWSGMDPLVGAAWIGGTIDSTGAVAAAGAVLKEDGLAVASTVKMIQNVLIGVIAFAVAVYWTARYGESEGSNRVGWIEIWHRFPKFVLGFIGASLLFSFLPVYTQYDGLLAETIGKQITSQIRVWLFCLAFVAFGLEINFRELSKVLSGSKPLLLYVIGQAWSMILSLAMAYLMFGVLYAEKIKEILAK